VRSAAQEEDEGVVGRTLWCFGALVALSCCPAVIVEEAEDARECDNICGCFVAFGLLFLEAIWDHITFWAPR